MSFRTPTAIQGVKNLQQISHRHSEPQYHFWGGEESPANTTCHSEQTTIFWVCEESFSRLA